MPKSDQHFSDHLDGLRSERHADIGKQSGACRFSLHRGVYLDELVRGEGTVDLAHRSGRDSGLGDPDHGFQAVSAGPQCRALLAGQDVLNGA